MPPTALSAEGAPAPARAGEHAPLLILALGLAQITSWGALYYAFPLFLEPMAAELGWSRTQMNAALSVGLLAAAGAAYPVGALIDREGGRRVMVLGTILGIAMLVAWSQVTSLLLFNLIWIGIGIAHAAILYEPVFATVTRLYPATFRQKIASITLIAGFASTVSVPLTLVFIETLGWRGALLALAGLMLAVSLPVPWVGLARELPATRRETATADDSGGHVRRAVGSPVFWLLALSFTAHAAFFSALLFHLVPLIQDRGLSAATAVGVVTVIGPSQVAGRILLLAGQRRISPLAIGRAIVVVLPLSIAVLAVAGTSWTGLALAAASYGASNGMITIVKGTAVPDLIGREAYGALNGLIAAPGTLARAAAPVAASWLWAAGGGYGPVLWALMALGVICAAGYWAATLTAPR